MHEVVTVPHLFLLVAVTTTTTVSTTPRSTHSPTLPTPSTTTTTTCRHTWMFYGFRLTTLKQCGPLKLLRTRHFVLLDFTDRPHNPSYTQKCK